MEELFSQVQEILVTVLTNLFNPDAWKAVLQRPEVTFAAFVVLNLIVFTETGLLVGFFLPGDSLLVTAGIVCALSGGAWPLGLLLATLCVSAVVGDSVGYSIGRKAGPKLFQREKSWLFRPDYLLRAQEFYERHGGKTIIIARFIPLIRTFAPVVAGVGRMPYRRFLFFNVFGGVGWVCGMVLLGYFLPSVIDPLLKPVFGPQFRVEKNIDKVIIVVVLISIAPLVWGGVKHWRNGRKDRVPADGQAKSAA